MRVPVAPSQFDEIIWPKKRLFKATPKEWADLKETVRILCQSGKVIKWSSQCVQVSEAQWPHVPVKYEIDGLEVKFSPSNSWCEVDGIRLKPPTNEKDFLDIIQAIKIFRRLGKIFRLKISDEVLGTLFG